VEVASVAQLWTYDFIYSEEECAFALFQAKWPDGFRCPRCQHHKSYRIDTRRLPLYQCAQCGAQPSLISGTVMEGTRTPLTSWFRAIQLHAAPEGINALQLSRIISVTYKTAWLICHKIRHAMSRAEAALLLTGLVKLTHTIYQPQGLADYFFDWHPREQALLVGASESGPGQFNRIKLKVQNKLVMQHKRWLPDTAEFIEQNVAEEARETVNIMSIRMRNRDRQVVRIADDAQGRLAELFRGVGPKHLQAYLDQYCYDWNWKGVAKFGNLLGHCAQTKTIIYRNLIARNSPASDGRSAPAAA